VTGINGILVRVRQGLAATARPGALSLSLGASFVSWTLEVNVILIAMRAVGLAMPLAAAILVLLAVNLALAFPLAPPGNLGTLEVGATLADGGPKRAPQPPQNRESGAFSVPQLGQRIP